VVSEVPQGPNLLLFWKAGPEAPATTLANYLTLYKRALTWISTAAILVALHAPSYAQPSTFIEFGGLRVPKSVLTIISIDLEDVSFEAALTDIAEKGNFALNYNRSRIPVTQKMTVRMEDVHALEALIYVMQKTGTELVVTNEGQLAVVPSKSQQNHQSPKTTLSGFVTDHKDGERLPNTTVVVAIENLELGTLSNTDGYYAIQGLLSGTCVVTVSYIGYAAYRDTLLLAAGQDLRRDIELDQEALHLQEIMVTAKDNSAENERSQQASVIAR